MTEVDALLRDLEAGLFLQTRMQHPTEQPRFSPASLAEGSLAITYDGRQVEPIQGLIGRDFVSWVDAHGLSIVPGHLASIRVYKALPTRASLASGQGSETQVLTESQPRVVMKHKLSMVKYLRGLVGQHVRLELPNASVNLTGSLVELRGAFGVFDMGTSLCFVELSGIRRISVPVHNFSEPQ